MVENTLTKKATAADWILGAAAGAGLGALPWIPGTWGSLGALPLWLLLLLLPAAWYLPLVLLFAGAAIYLAGRAEFILGNHDNPVIVIDEIAGLLLALTALPPSGKNFLWAFFLFRFFDIVKPFPANWCDDNLPGGFGVVVDDLVAGVMTWLVMWIFIV